GDGAAVIRGLEGEDARLAGGAKGGLQRNLDRFGSRDGKEDLGVVHRGDRGQPARQLDAERMGHDVAQGVEEAAGLLADGFDDPRVAMTDRGDSETRGEVDIE